MRAILRKFARPNKKITPNPLCRNLGSIIILDLIFINNTILCQSVNLNDLHHGRDVRVPILSLGGETITSTNDVYVDLGWRNIGAMALCLWPVQVRKLISLDCLANILTAGFVLKEAFKPSSVYEEHFGRHFKRQFGRG